MDYFITPSYNLVNKDMNGKTSPGQSVYFYTCVDLFYSVDHQVTGVEGRIVTVPVELCRLYS